MARGKRHDLNCPHCGAHASRRSSRKVTETFREIFFICSNVQCGHSFKATLSYDYGLSPSANPAPGVNLPMRPVERAAAIRSASIRDGPEPPPADHGQEPILLQPVD